MMSNLRKLYVKKNCDCFESCHTNKKWHSEVKAHPDTQDRSGQASSIETLPAEISTLKKLSILG